MNPLRASVSAFLLSLTAACASPPVQPPVVTVYRNVYLPDRFLVPCRITEWAGGSFAGVGELAVIRKAEQVDCNDQLRQAREYQDASRVEEAKTGL